jgi:signal transduction histidine kinase
MPATRSLKTKIALAASIPFILLLISEALIVFYEYEKATRDMVKGRDSELARILAARLGEGIDNSIGVFKRIVADDEIRSLDPGRIDVAMKDILYQFDFFDGGVAIYADSGAPIWSEPSNFRRTSSRIKDDLVALKASSTLRPVFSNIFNDDVSGEDTIFVGVPIIDKKGNFIGMLIGLATIKYSMLTALFSRILELKAGRSGYAYLVDGNGRTIFHRHRLEIGEDFSHVAPVAEVLKGEAGAVLTVDKMGVSIISGYAPVPGTDWGLVTREKWDDIVAPIRNYGRLLLGLVVAGAILSVLLIYVAIARVLRPISALTQGAKRIAEGDFSYSISAKTGDEIEILADHFNKMASALKDSFAELEHRLDERKRVLQELRQYKNRLEDLVEERTAELRKTQQELIKQERLAVLGHFTATVSHEIRNPLGTVRNSVYSIRDAVDNNELERIARAAEIAERNIVRCDKIIEELLDFTRVNKFKPVRLDIDAWLKETLQEFDFSDELEISVDLNSGAEVEIDPENFLRAVVNVLVNAQQALENKSDPQRITVSTCVQGNRMELSTIDNGCGISPDIRDKIFEPLFSTKNFGIGFGLPTIKQIMEEHHGGIDIESEEGKGTEVILWLPLHAQPDNGKE